MGFENTGRVWTVDSLKSDLAQIKKPDWCNSVTLHHTGAPSLAQRPNGFTAQHLRNIEHYYRVTKGWSSAPHLFVDEDQLWGMCDFRKKGVHAVSFNGRSIGIEVLGEYDTESPGSGRGLACWKNAAAATKVVLDWLGKGASKETVLFHRDDPTTDKSCPGTKVAKDWVLGLIGQPLPTEATEPTKKPTPSVKLAKDELRFEGVHWVAPVRVFLMKKGVSEGQIAERLKKRGKFFFYGEELLEDAFYDKATESTWASLHELEALKVG
jgi:hypothetical protein